MRPVPTTASLAARLAARLAALPAALLAVSLSGAAAPARAEDFTGFYAGVNAGYAFGRERASGTAVPGPAAAPPGLGAGTDLPPSAALAARQMRAGGRMDGRALPR